MGSHPSEHHVITKIQLYRVNHWSHDVLCKPHPNQHELDIHANHFSSYSSRSEITSKAHKTLQFLAIISVLQCNVFDVGDFSAFDVIYEFNLSQVCDQMGKNTVFGEFDKTMSQTIYAMMSFADSGPWLRTTKGDMLVHTKTFIPCIFNR